MSAHTVGPLPVSDEVQAAVEQTAERTGQDITSVATEMLTEAVKTRRVPGVAFGDSVHGRMAVVPGTGIYVWLVVQAYRTVGEDWDRLRQGYHWLSEHQLRVALAYADAYPEEIEERIRANESWTPERVWAEYPFMKPPSR